ncbi:hypothetical protein [Mycoplasma suis]|uniref:Uncharacterized protein n=1 Tax=Mycoplasma suis (strain Illinois) TaxID=768700 RepID=F0QQJ1_MYCSL|nr:hypothetical protein [Mycoplasma suis]ADX97761.1 hypothetical protein MSU_0217 [Mycoplasma suis str. Illinois]
MLGDLLSAKRLITSFFGIAVVAGGGGIGLTSLLMGKDSTGRVELPPKETPSGRLERDPEIKLEKERIAEYIYKDEQSEKPICRFWDASGITRKATSLKMTEEECEKLIKEIPELTSLNKPFKWLKTEWTYISKTLKELFIPSLSEDPVSKYTSPEKNEQWTFNKEWLCTNSSSENKEIVSCQKVGREELIKQGFQINN